MCFITQRRKELEATVLLAVLINGNLLELDHEFIDFLYANNPSLAKKSEPACSFTGRSSSFIFLSVTTVGNLILFTVPAPLTAAVSNQKLSFWALDCHIKSK